MVATNMQFECQAVSMMGFIAKAKKAYYIYSCKAGFPTRKTPKITIPDISKYALLGSIYNIFEMELWAWKTTQFFSRAVKILCYDTQMRLRGSSQDTKARKLPESRSERNLAVAILRQAWHEAVMDLRSVKETSRNDYQLLQKKAIEWISTDDNGFPYWCKLADVDHLAVRQRPCDSIPEP